jgi:hypothetical protein
MADFCDIHNDRTASWDTSYGLAPIFDMNLPEGALRACLMRSFAKATGMWVDVPGLSGRCSTTRDGTRAR